MLAASETPPIPAQQWRERFATPVLGRSPDGTEVRLVGFRGIDRPLDPSLPPLEDSVGIDGPTDLCMRQVADALPGWG